MGASITIPPKALASMELFLDLPSAALSEVRAAARPKQLPRQTRIFGQGDPAERAHALLRGGVRISQSGTDGAQTLIRMIAPGEMFGTVALFTDRHYPADATTLSESLEISWSEADLLELIRRHPQIAMNVIRIVGGRLKEAQERVRELSTQRVERRVAQTVLRLARQAGQTTSDGTAIEFPLRRKDVADMSGTTLHTASRILTAWEKAG
ncbi:MAG: Crp/Fnr family transcriptional regulator, partial [Mycobacteriales bacterium]